MLSNGAVDGLTDPPGGIGAEFESAPGVKFSDGAQKSHVAFLDQVKQWNAAPKIALGNAHHQTQICTDQRLLRICSAKVNGFHFSDQLVIGRQVAEQGTLRRKTMMHAHMCQ